MLSIVLVTSVIVGALRSGQGAGNALLREVAQGNVELLATPALFFEYEEVLKRAEHRIVTGMSEDAMDRFLAALASACRPVEIRYRWRPQLPDANDEMLLETAVNGQADALVTYNLKHFRTASVRFGLRVMQPGTFLMEMRDG